MPTFHAYLDRRSNLIVRRYMGEIERQHYRDRVREHIGIFDATDAADARIKANKLLKGN